MITVDGLGRIQRRIMMSIEEMPSVLAKAMVEEMKIEKKTAQARTPVSDKGSPPTMIAGALRDSITVTKPEIRGNHVFVGLTAGGPTAPYAVYVHEKLDDDHKVGEAKFLEKTIRESRPFMAERLARRIAKMKKR